MSTSVRPTSSLPAITEPQSSMSEATFRSFRELILAETGIDLSDNKRQLLEGRLAKRLRATSIETFEKYYDRVKTLGKTDPEHTNFINAITTNKTDFFRESHHFEYLTKTVIPTIKERASHSGDRKLRIWCSASSTGEEPYTLAMTVCEAFAGQAGWDLKILATDIDTDVLAKAEAGVYDLEKLQEVPIELRQKYFEHDKSGQKTMRAKAELRRLLTFRRLNLMDDWPFKTQFDVIFCRNVLIYFSRNTQRRVIMGFAKHLKPDGWMFLGHSESLHGVVDCFDTVERTVYKPNAKAPNFSASAAPASPPPALKAAPRSASSPLISKSRVSVPAAPASRPAVEIVQPSSSAAPTTNLVLPQKRIIAGEIFASRTPTQVATLLGSCVAACLYDPEIGVGGMNHFMLPSGSDDSGSQARFGVNAMELLINELMKLGCDRRRIVAKVFGAGHVLRDQKAVDAVPDKNARFIRKYLEDESIPLLAQRLGGNAAVEVRFETHSAKVFLKVLNDESASKVIAEESRYEVDIANSVKAPSTASNVILF